MFSNPYVREFTDRHALAIAFPICLIMGLLAIKAYRLGFALGAALVGP